MPDSSERPVHVGRYHQFARGRHARGGFEFGQIDSELFFKPWRTALHRRQIEAESFDTAALEHNMDSIGIGEVLIGVLNVSDKHVGAQEARKAQRQTQYVYERMQLPGKKGSPGRFQVVSRHEEIRLRYIAN